MHFKENLKDMIRVFRTERKSVEALRSEIHIRVVVSLLMSAASLVLTLMNIAKQYWFMAGTTAVLFVGFGVSALLLGVFRRRRPAFILMAIMVALIFSVYAVLGENEGFAILWILLVPTIGMNLLDLDTGFMLCLYYLVFLIALFYTPLSKYVDEYYTATFQSRFPVLYLTCMVAALIMALQKHYYYIKSEGMAYRDVLTGLYNRRKYEEIKDEIPADSSLSIISVDLNSLKHANDTLGHQAGDELLIGASDCLLRSFPDAVAVCRTGGDEYMVITRAEGTALTHQLETLRQSMNDWRGERCDSLHLSIGAASRTEFPDMGPDELEKQADQRMYDDKSRYYATAGVERRRR